MELGSLDDVIDRPPDLEAARDDAAFLKRVGRFFSPPPIRFAWSCGVRRLLGVVQDPAAPLLERHRSARGLAALRRRLERDIGRVSEGPP